MTKRLVVCLRWRAGDEAAPPGGFASAADLVIERLSALGGRLILWHPEWLAIDFSLEALQDAIDFIIDRPPRGFSIGFSYGPLKEVVDGGPMLAACLGPAVETAVALARMARVGEVLIEPSLVRASGAELLVQGARVATLGSTRIRGLKLDLAHPQRSLECESVARLAQPGWHGRALPELSVRERELSLLLAAPGAGGSRFLREHRERENPRALFFSRYASGQPLAALHHALRCDELAGGPQDELPGLSRASFEALGRGQAIQPGAAVKLVCQWIEARSLPRVVYIDDAGEVDHDSLEVLVGAATRCGLGLLASLHPEALVPLPLAELPVCQKLLLPELSSSDAVELLREMTDEQLSVEWAEKLAARGMPWPLGVTQSLVEALDSASFLWGDAGVTPRVQRDEVPEAREADALLRRRLHFVELTDRLLLDALAVLGGSAKQSELGQLLKLAGRGVAGTDASLSYLARMGWVLLGPTGYVSLATRTHRQAIVSSLSDKRFKTLHQAAASLRSESGSPLALASAAYHAGLAGNVGKAALLARRAAASLRAAQLGSTASAFEQFAEAGDPSVLRARGLTGGRADQRRTVSVSAQDEQFLDASLSPETNSSTGSLPMQTLPATQMPATGTPDAAPGVSVVAAVRAPRDGFADAADPGSDAARDRKADEAPPRGLTPDLGKAEREPERVSETDLEAMSSADANELEPVSEEPEGNVGVLAVGSNATPARGGERKGSETLRVAGVPSDSESLMPARAALALLRGDPVTLDELAKQLRSEAHSMLADRLDAMASLVRGNVGDALRRLRDAKAQASEQSLSDQCRASLALSIAVAAAGRPSDALLEVLEGLARARRAGDIRGERACAKFLSQLATRSGHEQIAEAWHALSIPDA